MEATEVPAVEIPDAKVLGVLRVLDKVLSETYNQLDGYPGWQYVIAQIGMGFAACQESEE